MRAGLLAALVACGLARAEGQRSYEVETPAIATDTSLKQLKHYRTPAARFKVELGKTTEHRLCVGRAIAFPSAEQKRWPTVTGTLYYSY